ncbi:MAG: hypothetical protein NTY67_06995 [Cyanobacteria bacterium]|nr:hypothetical protein [Cyanobacteriota bacterium]
MSLDQQIGLDGLQALALIGDREGRRLDRRQIGLQPGEALGADNGLVELLDARLLAPPGLIREGLGVLQAAPGRQTLQGDQQQKADRHPAAAAAHQQPPRLMAT